MRRSSLSSVLALALGVTGCSSILGIDDPRLTDGGSPPGDATDAPPDAATDQVSGRSFYRVTTRTGTSEVALDLSATPVRALVADGAEPTGYRVVNGTGRADGTFAITGVPAGARYLLSIGANYHDTDQHVIDRHFDVVGRPDAQRATAATQVAMNVTNMQAFNVGVNGVDFDTLEIDAFDVGYFNNVGATHNATTASEPFDWRSGFNVSFGDGAPLPVGDGVYVFHLRDGRHPVASGRKLGLTRVIDHALAGPVTIESGVATSLGGAFSPVPLDRTLMLQNFQRGAYDSAYDPSTEISSTSIGLYAGPYANDYAYGVPLAVVNYDDWSRSTSLSLTTAVPYGDPFAPGWTRILTEDYLLLRYFKLPGTNSPRFTVGGSSRRRALPAGAPGLAPGLQPPTNVKIGTVDASVGGKVTFDGQHPLTITWGAVVGARMYRVLVSRVFANGNQTASQRVATLTTDRTMLAVPAEVFAGGEFFAFSISAIQSPSDYATGVLSPNGLPNLTATVPSGLFRLRATCGDGAMDNGESCDGGGETAMCDVDCTPVQCGDGLVNHAAGEACDSVRETRGCDIDCTLPVCGDGRFNRALEDCDDGNVTADGNGCSAECKFNNTCGNGAVEALVEQCDTGGNTVACDADCTVRMCGDGFVNAAAGEQCDLGGLNGAGFGCTQTCTNG